MIDKIIYKYNLVLNVSTVIQDREVPAQRQKAGKMETVKMMKRKRKWEVRLLVNLVESKVQDPHCVHHAAVQGSTVLWNAVQYSTVQFSFPFSTLLLISPPSSFPPLTAHPYLLQVLWALLSYQRSRMSPGMTWQVKIITLLLILFMIKNCVCECIIFFMN